MLQGNWGILMVTQVTGDTLIVTQVTGDTLMVTQVTGDTLMVTQVTGDSLMVTQVTGDTLMVTQVTGDTLMVTQATGDPLTSLPPSLPKPLSLYPPKPAAASNTLWQLTQQLPALMLMAVSKATLRFSVHTLEAEGTISVRTHHVGSTHHVGLPRP